MLRLMVSFVQEKHCWHSPASHLPLQDMLLLFIIAPCVLFGSSAGVSVKKECYGGNFKFPFIYTPPLFNGQLYFTPNDGGPRKILMDDGKAKDPRIKVPFGVGVVLTDMREGDAGMFSASDDGKTIDDIMRLRILECANEIKAYYGQMYVFDVPSGTEYLEFSPPHSKNQTKILWNRSNPKANKGERGKMRPGGWYINSATQEDDGYYNFRKKDNTLLSRKKLTVQESFKHYDINVNGQLVIQNPSDGGPWTVTFSPEGEQIHQTLIEEGRLLTEDDWISMPFSGRLQVVYDGIEIEPVEVTDAGNFEFRDKQGNLAQVVTVVVNHDHTTKFVLAASVVGIILVVIVCCCCVKRCCCKKSSSKRDRSALAAVYHHDPNQPGDLCYSAAPAPDYSHQPVNLPAPRKPAATSIGTSVAAPGEQGAAPAPSLGSDCLSSDHEPQFKLKGLDFLSASPLSSDSTSSDVYTSDKLNFL